MANITKLNEVQRFVDDFSSRYRRAGTPPAHRTYLQHARIALKWFLRERPNGVRRPNGSWATPNDLRACLDVVEAEL